MLALMARDKKVKEGQIRLILLNEIGKATITADFKPSLLDQTLAAALN